MPPVSVARDEKTTGELVRAVAGLCLIGASLGLAFSQLAVSDLTQFVSGNALSRTFRKVMLGALGGGTLLVGLAAALVARRSPAGPARTARLTRMASLAAPLALSAALPGLFSSNSWSDALTLSLILAAFLLGIEPLLRLHFSAYRPPDPTAPPTRLRRLHTRLIERLPPPLRRYGACAVVGAAVAGYAAYMIFFTLRGHAKFNTFTWDLGLIDNEFYNALHGHPFRSTALVRAGNWSALRNHADLALYVLLPLYALHPAAGTLVVLQCLLLAAGAIFLYRFAARRLPPWLAVLVTLAYLVYPPLHGAQFFDFHFQTVGAVFVLAAIDAFDGERMRIFVVLFLIALGCNEGVSIGTAFLGLYLMFSGRRVRAGAVIALVSIGYFVVMRLFVMRAAGSTGFADLYRPLLPNDDATVAGVAKTLITNPLYAFGTLQTSDKARYLLLILTPVAFLPLRRPAFAALLIPGAILTILTNGDGPVLDIGYQYGAEFIPYVFVATVLALAWLSSLPDGRVRRRAATATLALAALIATANWGAFPPRHAFHSSWGDKSFDPPTPQERRRLTALKAAMRLVPRQAILAASDRELPHVSNRVECWNLSVGFRGADYAIYGKIGPIQPDVDQIARARAAGWLTAFDTPEIGLLKRPGAPTVSN